MGDLKAIGSEKLTGQDKINRIMEIARYGESTKNTEYHTHTNSFTKRAANGVTYAIVHEKDGYYVKSGLNESELDYVNGLSNKKKNRYKFFILHIHMMGPNNNLILFKVSIHFGQQKE